MSETEVLLVAFAASTTLCLVVVDVWHRGYAMVAALAVIAYLVSGLGMVIYALA